MKFTALIGPVEDLSVRLARCAAVSVTTAQELAWRGPDPYDALYWRWPRVVMAHRRTRQAVTQLHARSPIDVRAWRRRPPPRLAKTLALFTTAGLLANDAAPEERLRAAALESVEALCGDRAAGVNGWGYPFMVQTRWSCYPADSPNAVVTSFAIEALLLAAERFQAPSYRHRAANAAAWLMSTLMTPRGHFAYHEHSQALIHNANLLGAAAAYQAGGDASRVFRAIEPTLDAQRSDGSWPYGDGAGLGFVDSFHTAYVLRSLVALRELDPAIDDAIDRGSMYWRTHFFDEHGRATLWPDRRFPEDGHSAGTALSTLALLSQHDFVDDALLRKVAERAVGYMIRRGRAVHRRNRWGHTRVRYLRWCDGHMAVGMAAAAVALGSR